MIVVDTNVISESIRVAPDPAVRDWLNKQAATTLYVSSVSIAELHLGVELLDDGARKDELREAIAEALTVMFADRILAFDELAARRFGTVMATAKRAGRAVSMADGQIAAIALGRNFEVATPDTAPFAAVGVRVVDPWTSR